MLAPSFFQHSYCPTVACQVPCWGQFSEVTEAQLLIFQGLLTCSLMLTYELERKEGDGGGPVSEWVLGIHLSRWPSLRPSPNKSPRGPGRTVQREQLWERTPESGGLVITLASSVTTSSVFDLLPLLKMGVMEHISHPKVVHRSTSGLERMPASPGITPKAIPG